MFGAIGALLSPLRAAEAQNKERPHTAPHRTNRTGAVQPSWSTTRCPCARGDPGPHPAREGRGGYGTAVRAAPGRIGAGPRGRSAIAPPQPGAVEGDTAVATIHVRVVPGSGPGRNAGTRAACARHEEPRGGLQRGHPQGAEGAAVLSRPSPPTLPPRSAFVSLCSSQKWTGTALPALRARSPELRSTVCADPGLHTAERCRLRREAAEHRQWQRGAGRSAGRLRAALGHRSLRLLLPRAAAGLFPVPRVGRGHRTRGVGTAELLLPRRRCAVRELPWKPTALPLPALCSGSCRRASPELSTPGRPGSVRPCGMSLGGDAIRGVDPS